MQHCKGRKIMMIGGCATAARGTASALAPVAHQALETAVSSSLPCREPHCVMFRFRMLVTGVDDKRSTLQPLVFLRRPFGSGSCPEDLPFCSSSIIAKLHLDFFGIALEVRGECPSRASDKDRPNPIAEAACHPILYVHSRFGVGP